MLQEMPCFLLVVVVDVACNAVWSVLVEPGSPGMGRPFLRLEDIDTHEA